MAPGRISVGGVVVAAACLALTVTGCGGSSSSAPGATGSSAAPAPTNKSASDSGGGSTTATATTSPSKAHKNTAEPKAHQPEEADKSQSEGGEKYEKKHPPLQLPEGPPEPKITKAQKERVPSADIAVTVPGGLTAANTCKGKNLSPAISWGSIPPGTAELAIFVLGVKPVNGALYYNWAVAGVDPSLSGLKAGELPKGAVLGRNGSGKNGYSMCPEGSEPESYIFSVYAVPKSLSPKPGFEAADLRRQASRISDEVGVVAATLGG